MARLHICPICHCEFVDNPSKPRTYCSKICQYQGVLPPKSKPGQRRSKPSTQITHSCIVCKARFKDDPSKPRTYCSKVCQYLDNKPPRQTRDKNGILLKPWQDRFWHYVNKAPHPKQCWIWTGRTNKKGYGTIGVKGRSYFTHRLSYELHYGLLLPGIQICHRCDNPPCVRPDHLFAGTAWDNAQDAYLKGSYAKRAVILSSKRHAGRLTGVPATISSPYDRKTIVS